MMSHFFEIRITPKQIIKLLKEKVQTFDKNGNGYNADAIANVIPLATLHHRIKLLFKKVADKYECERYVTCFEKLSTRDGSDLSLVDKEHFHFRFETLEKVKKDTLQSWVKRNADFQLSATGNCCYAIIAFDVENDDDWWQYPFKECYLPTLTKGFTGAQIMKFKIAGAAIHKRAIATNKKRALLKNLKKTLFIKIAQFLEDLPTPVVKKQEIFLKILEYYLKNDIELNPTSMMAKVDRYRLFKKIITPRDYYHINFGFHPENFKREFNHICDD